MATKVRALLAVLTVTGTLTACQTAGQSGGGGGTPVPAPPTALIHTWVDQIVQKNGANGLNTCYLKLQFQIQRDGERQLAAQVYYMVSGQVEIPSLMVKATLFDFPVRQAQRFRQIDDIDVVTSAGRGPRQTITAALDNRLVLIHPDQGAEKGIIGSFQELVNKGGAVNLISEGRAYSFKVPSLPKNQFKELISCVKERVRKVDPAVFRRMADEARKQGNKEVKGRATYPVALELARSLTLSPLDSALRQKFGFSETVKGVIVTGLTPFGGENPVREGDVIEAVDGVPVSTLNDVNAQISKVQATPQRGLRLDVVCKYGKCPKFI